MKYTILGGILFVGLLSALLAALWRGANRPDAFGRTEISPQMHAIVVAEVSPDGSIREIGRLVYEHETLRADEPFILGDEAEMAERGREIFAYLGER